MIFQEAFFGGLIDLQELMSSMTTGIAKEQLLYTTYSEKGSVFVGEISHTNAKDVADEQTPPGSSHTKRKRIFGYWDDYGGGNLFADKQLCSSRGSPVATSK